LALAREQCRAEHNGDKQTFFHFLSPLTIPILDKDDERCPKHGEHRHNQK